MDESPVVSAGELSSRTSQALRGLLHELSELSDALDNLLEVVCDVWREAEFYNEPERLSSVRCYKPSFPNVLSALASVHDAAELLLKAHRSPSFGLLDDRTYLNPAYPVRNFIEGIGRELAGDFMHSIGEWQEVRERLRTLTNATAETRRVFDAQPPVAIHYVEKGLEWIRQMAGGPPTTNGAEREAAVDGPATNGEPRLRDVDADKVERALQFICENPGAVQRVVAAHIDVSPDTFRKHYRRALESRGVVNGVNRRGLYVDEAARIEHDQSMRREV